MADAATARRRQDIELLRIVAAFGIVWFHSAGQGIAVAYSGLVVFIVFSVMLGGRRGPADVASVQRRATRLLLPWLLWCAVYGAVNVWRGGDFLPAGANIASRVLAGPSIHLWYLPFIFLCLNGIDVLKAHVRPAMLARAAGLLALVLVATAPWWRPVSLGLPYPLLQWADAAAPVAAGLFLYSAPALPRWQRGAIGLSILAAALLTAVFNDIGVAYSIAFALCGLIATGVTADRLPFRVNTVADAMFGVYLIHALVFLFLLTHTTLAGPAMPVAIFCTALPVVLLLRRVLPRFAAFWS